MKIEEIIYETTRDLLNVEDKLRIATVFLFCEKMSNIKMAELLYGRNPEKFVNSLNVEYAAYEVDFTIDFANKNIKIAFENTRKKVSEKYDSDGFYRAVFRKDDFAMAICEICERLDKVKFEGIQRQIQGQLSIF